MKKWILIVLTAAVICAFGWVVSNRPKTVGKAVKEGDFKEFYYTYSTTVNPPEFQRYRIYIDENGRRMFYHEKREGDRVFLTEEDITVAGERELTSEEWDTFWNCISGGVVVNRRESVTSGGAGPWLYLYWKGDKDKCQVFTFGERENLYEFEEFCKGLKESMQK